MLCSVSQRYNLKAIHNLQVFHTLFAVLCSVSQRYNLKAIHNAGLLLAFSVSAVFSKSKIQFESNSQLYALDESNEPSCVQ